MVRIWFATCFIVLFFETQEAQAYNTEKDRQTDFSAYTLQQNQYRLGLFQLEYGVLDSLMVGTYTLPWLIMPVTQSPSFDLYSKWKFIDIDSWAASIKGTVFYFDVNGFSSGTIDDGVFRATIVPLSLMLSHVFNDEWTGSFESAWVQTFISGAVDTSSEASAFGAGAQSNFQVALTGEYRVNHVLALNFLGRWVPYVTEARVSSNVSVNDATEVQITADLSAEDLINAWQLQTGVTFSWKTFNLQMGVGYGNVFIPGLRIVGPSKFILPDFDLYFRF